MVKAVTHERQVLACFKDKEDERLCAAVMRDIDGIVRITGVTGASLLSLSMEISADPRLVILSSRLYPGKCPDLVQEMKLLYPAAEFLLLTPANDPLPQFQQLARDQVRHLTVTPLGEDQEGAVSLRDFVDKLLEKKRWSMRDYLRPGTPIHYFPISSSCQKENLIVAIEQLLGGDAEELEMLRQKAALLADEMIENALYGAPRGDDGGKLYPKGVNRDIHENEGVSLRVAFDGKNLAMEIADGWGTLSPDQVVSCLANNQDAAGLDDDTGGRGLFIIWRFMDHFHVSISPGQQTVLGGHLKAGSPLDSEAPKGFSISTHFH